MGTEGRGRRRAVGRLPPTSASRERAGAARSTDAAAHDLSFQLRLRLERRDQYVEEQTQQRDHCGSTYLIPPFTPARMEFLLSTMLDANAWRTWRGAGRR